MAIEDFDVEDSERDALPLLVGLMGPTGGGKSLTSLRLGLGIQRYREAEGLPGPIIVIDAENGKSKLYSPKSKEAPDPPKTFAFKRIDLRPPFSPDRYQDALEAATLLDPACIIIDGVTPEWNGILGVLEWHDKEAEKTGNPHAAWNKPKTAHTRFAERLKNLQCPVIVTFRAKERTKQVGKSIVDAGWRAISEGELPYEMLFTFLVGAEDPGHLSYDRALSDHVKYYSQAEGLIEEGELGTEEVGERLIKFADGVL